MIWTPNIIWHHLLILIPCLFLFSYTGHLTPQTCPTCSHLRSFVQAVCSTNRTFPSSGSSMTCFLISYRSLKCVTFLVRSFLTTLFKITVIHPYHPLVKTFYLLSCCSCNHAVFCLTLCIVFSSSGILNSIRTRVLDIYVQWCILGAFSSGWYLVGI